MTSFLDQRTPRIVPLQSKAWISLTPQTLFAALAEIPSLFWLDSGDSADGWSYIGYGPARRLSSAALLSLAAYSIDDDKLIVRNDLPPFHSGILLQLNYPAGDAPFRLSKALVYSALRAYRFDTILAYTHARKAWFCVSNAQHGSNRQFRESLEEIELFFLNRNHKIPKRSAQKWACTFAHRSALFLCNTACT